MSHEATRIMRQAQELKQEARYADALVLRLKLEQLYQHELTNVVEQSLNLNSIASLAVLAGNLDEAERAARKCVDIYLVASSERDERLATYLMMLSFVLAEKGNFHEAVRWGEEALASFGQLLGDADSFVQYRQMDIERMRRGDTGPYLER